MSEYKNERDETQPEFSHEECPVCELLIARNWIKRHLVKMHGWRYTDEDRVWPQPPEGYEQ